MLHFLSKWNDSIDSSGFICNEKNGMADCINKSASSILSFFQINVSHLDLLF